MAAHADLLPHFARPHQPSYSGGVLDSDPESDSDPDRRYNSESESPPASPAGHPVSSESAELPGTALAVA